MYPQTHRHSLWTPLVVLALAISLFVAVVYLNVAASVFQLLGLSAAGAAILLGASLVGSMINIPLTRKRIQLVGPEVEDLPAFFRWLLPIVHYYPPLVAEEVIAINVGGALVPIVFSGYLLLTQRASVLAAVLATVVVALVAKLLARPVPQMGITLPTFIPPIVAALAALALVHVLGIPATGAPAVAYIAGTLGTLIGADLLNLDRLEQGTLAQIKSAAEQGALPRGKTPGEYRSFASIGGAGVFDGIFVTSIVAPLLATL